VAALALVVVAFFIFSLLPGFHRLSRWLASLAHPHPPGGPRPARPAPAPQADGQAAPAGAAPAAGLAAEGAAAAPAAPPRPGFLREVAVVLVGFFTSLLPTFNYNPEDAAAFAMAQELMAREQQMQQQEQPGGAAGVGAGEGDGEADGVPAAPAAEHVHQE
jgi:hypothetical protein